MANVNQEIDTIRVGGVDYEVSDPHALYGEHDESAPDLTDNPLYESDLVAQIANDSTKPSAANVPYQLKQEINQISSDLASKANCITIDSAITSPYFFYSVDGATALFGAIPLLYMGLCYARFKNSINTICLVNKANGAYGTIILMNDIGSAPLLISVSGGTLTVKDFTVS